MSIGICNPYLLAAQDWEIFFLEWKNADTKYRFLAAERESLLKKTLNLEREMNLTRAVRDAAQRKIDSIDVDRIQQLIDVKRNRPLITYRETRDER